jgi:hypothetical protein
MFLAQRAHQVRTEARSGWEMRPLVNRRPSDFQKYMDTSSPNTVNVRDLHRPSESNAVERGRT